MSLLRLPAALSPPCARAAFAARLARAACAPAAGAAGYFSGAGSPPGGGHPLGFADGGGGLFGAPFRATTILSVRRRGRVAVVGDGQVSRGSEVVKPNAVKVRRIGGDANGGTISGFAGSTADCLALRERLEAKLEAHPGQLTRACVELAKEWRTEKYLRRVRRREGGGLLRAAGPPRPAQGAPRATAARLRRAPPPRPQLEAVMLVVDKDVSLTVTGIGDVMEPADGVIAIGSGGSYALAAARALLAATDLPAMEIAERAMGIAADMCVYTNREFVRDELVYEEAPAQAPHADAAARG